MINLMQWSGKIAAKYMQKTPDWYYCLGIYEYFSLACALAACADGYLAVMACVSHRSAERNARLPALT